MNPATMSVRPETAAVESPRVLSLDIFRGLTMLVMIFVNDIAGVKGLPWWTYHMPPGTNGMTYVDMVFPAFLFIVGMSIPLSVQHRLAKGDSWPRLWAHILLRSVSLVAIGVFIANLGKLDPRLAGIGRGWWGMLGFVGAILLWNVYPKTGKRRILYTALKCTGFLLLLAMFAIFRRTTPDGRAAWLDFSYWEILGLIGHTYLAACILYVPFRKKPWAPAVLLAVLVALNVASRLGWAGALHRLPYWLWPFDAGELPSIAMAGIVASNIFLDGGFARSLRAKAGWALAYAGVLFVAGWALLPFGISKLGATPTWCLWCSALSVMLFLALYWLADIRHRKAWAAFVKPAGSNTLLTYLLPDIFYTAISGWYAASFAGSGWPGAGRSLVFTLLILAAAAVLTRWKVRMQL